MKKIAIVFLVLLGLFSSSPNPLISLQTYAQQKPIPSYAKWGGYAIKQTKEKYPNAKIVDYLYMGKTKGAQSTTEKFKLWLKDDKREFGVIITIEFNNKTEKVIKVTFKETTN